jgi:hypothetical protein
VSREGDALDLFRGFVTESRAGEAEHDGVRDVDRAALVGAEAAHARAVGHAVRRRAIGVLFADERPAVHDVVAAIDWTDADDAARRSQRHPFASGEFSAALGLE